MIGMILTGHGNFGSGLYSSVKLISGEKENFVVCDFVEGMGADEDLMPMLEKAVADLSATCDGVLIFTDLKGGSPFQKAVTVAYGKENIEVVAGSNLPMILEASMAREFIESLEDLTNMAISTGKDQVYRYVYEERKVACECEDGI